MSEAGAVTIRTRKFVCARSLPLGRMYGGGAGRERGQMIIKKRACIGRWTFRTGSRTEQGYGYNMEQEEYYMLCSRYSAQAHNSLHDYGSHGR